MNDNIVVRIDKELKNKLIFVLRTKGKNITQAVREMAEEYAKEFDEKK